MDRYEFLTQLHKLFHPRVYLEIGVQTGASLRLAHEADLAVGVDPAMAIYPPLPPGNFHLSHTTSDGFFKINRYSDTHVNVVDLAFIDGMHLFENVADDYINTAELIRGYGLIVVDDVLPRNKEEAAREQCPGDWTGDVWKLYYYLYAMQPYQTFLLVDTEPTGLLLAPCAIPIAGDRQYAPYISGEALPSHAFDQVLSRELAISPDAALRYLGYRI